MNFWRTALILPWCLPLILTGQAKYAGELFEFPGDARSVAMGGTGVSSTHEAATGFYNPALVGQPHLSSLVLAHREQFGGMVNADLVAVNFGRFSDLAVHVGVVQRGVDDIPDTRNIDSDGDGVFDGDWRDKITYFSQREWGLLISVARKNQVGWHFGASAKIVGQWLADELGLGLGFDLGVWRRLHEAVALGIMVQDITTTQVHWSTGRWETTAPRITMGLQVDITLPLIQRPLILAGELTTRLDGEREERSFQAGPLSVLSRGGLTLMLNDNLALRAGSATLQAFSLGAGLTFPAFSIDYAFVSDTGERVFDPTHQISLVLYVESLRNFLGIG